MEIIVIIFIIILLLLINYNMDLFENYNNIINENDNKYFKNFYKKNNIDKLINNNKLKIPIKKKNKILFITYDNRYQEEYVLIHNYNINKYTEKYGYEYKYYNICNENVYWCKIYMVLDALLKNDYDYVIWMDSDTVIKNFNIDIGEILNMFSSDIFIGSDNNKKYSITNSGVFIIKNSDIGKKFLNNCINDINTECLNNDGTLKGVWAASCYEQGIMNILIDEKYSKYTTVLTNKVIFNYNICSDEVFIMHLYASKPKDRVACFQSNNPVL
jgi:hypothetical protein